MATRRSKAPRAEDLASQPDAKAPLDWQVFLQAAQPVLKLLQDDLRTRAKTSPSVGEALKARHAAERDNKRTADSFVEWQDHFIEQVAAAWLLSCVFVRTLEDRGLLGHNRLAGPGAADSLKLFLDIAPSLNERDYLLTVFRELTRFASTKELFDARHNPVWLLTPSAEGAKALVQLFQQPHADVPAFRFGQSDTGFLGWLYQDLDAGVRERFALLQTPRFVESFILDRTLEPAIAKFGLDDTTLIDPTCGSGHFLLGAFERLVDHRLRTSPGLSTREAATKALDAVFGSDINPYAVGIARFRLTLAFLDKAGFTRLATAPSLPLHVVVGDSLLHNPHVSQPDFANVAASTLGWQGEEFSLADEGAARAVFGRKFSAVVGNPPYITVKDAVLRDRYKKLYASAFREYSLGVPFTECFFQLARSGGRVGMITANSFMKREFGKKLIESFVPTVNLDLVINTSGAYIPGHGTPTVLLFGSAEAPQGTAVATVLASRGEPTTPDDPEQGLVWRSISEHWSEPGFDNEFISVAAIDRASFKKHPWSLGGGGALEVKDLLEERASSRLKEIVSEIGFVCMTRADDIYFVPRDALHRAGLTDEHIIENVEGEVVRDWAIATPNTTLFPYDSGDLKPTQSIAVHRFLWPYRTMLWLRREPNGNHKEIGLTWWEWSRFQRARFLADRKITFAFVATHNHFVLDRGGKVFKQSAPIIKLPDTATEDDHLALLAYLNSSTACFWMKQVFYPKATTNSDISTEKGKPEDNRFEFAGTGMEALPLPSLPPASRTALIDLARRASSLAQSREALSPNWFVHDVAGATPRFDTLAALDGERKRLLSELVVVQEEIDWLVYAAFGLSPPAEPTSEASPPLPPTRPFEWTAVGADAAAPAAWRQRWATLHSKDHKMLKVLEDPMHKRLWSGRRGVFGHSAGELIDQVCDAARSWVEEQAEAALRQEVSVATVASLVRAVPEAVAQRVVAVFGGNDAASFAREALRDGEAVPYLAAHRFTDGGLDRYAEWERAWDLQRREDAGEKVETILVPPKYGQGDYRSTTSWQLRGPLDVPKERFISYPGCESDHDGEPVYGWAGWDHEQRARALATLYVNRRDEESWTKDRLTPMLAGLLELVPWLKQWHGAPSDDYAGVSPGAYYEGFLDDECRKHGLTRDDLRAWRPAEKKRGKKAAPTTTAAAAATADADDEVAATPKKRGRKKKSAATDEANE